MYNLLKSSSTFLICILLYSYITQAQVGNDGLMFYLKNYSPKDYKAHSQNWAIVQDKRGVIYFGNNAGVLEYDGLNWNTIIVANYLIVRSLAVDSNGIVYVGSLGDFGYLSPDNKGELSYVSLIPKLSEEDKEFADVWKTYSTPEGIYFQTFSSLFRWNGKEVKVWKPNSSFFLSYLVRNKLFIPDRKTAVMSIKNDSLFIIPDGEKLINETIYTIFPYPIRKKSSNDLLICSRNNGIFLYHSIDNSSSLKDSVVITSFKTEADGYLSYNQLFNGLVLENRRYALATRRGGIVLFDEDGKWQDVIARINGLQDESVKALYTDKEQGLWTALDNGISRIEAQSPLRYANAQCGLRGGVQSITRFNQKLFVATKQGVYVLNQENNFINQYKRTESQPNTESEINLSNLFISTQGITSQCWDLLLVKNVENDKLLVAANDGIYEIILTDPKGSDQNYKAVLIKNGSCYKLYQSQRDPDLVLAGMNDGLNVIKLKKSQNKINKTNESIWEDLGMVQGIKDPIRSLGEDINGNLWLETGYQGIIKLNLSVSDSINAFQVTRFDTTFGFPDMTVNHILLFNKRLLIGTMEGMYRYDKDANRFFPDSTFGIDFASGKKQVFRFSEDFQDQVWMFDLHNTEIGVARKNIGNTYKWDPIPFKNIPEMTIHAIYPEPSGITWLGGDDGIVRYDQNILRKYSADFATLIRKVKIGEDSTVFNGYYWNDQALIDSTDLKKPSLIQPEELKLKLPYNYNSLTFEFSATTYVNEKAVSYKFFLEGFEKTWSDWKKDSKRQYTNLQPGKYTFKVKAKNIYNTEGKEAEYEFTILPPFYQTWWFYVGQILFFLILISVSLILSRSDSGTKLATVFVTVSIVLVFEYVQNLVESNFDTVFGGVAFFKVLLNVVLAFLLLPVEFILKKFVFKHKGGGSKNEVIEGIKAFTKKLESTSQSKDWKKLFTFGKYQFGIRKKNKDKDVKDT